MCNQEHLIGYVYDELTAAERAAFDAHIESCAACREEVQTLCEARQHLASWAPPEPALDFTVVRGGRAAAPPPRWRPLVPAWALAAAASVLFLAGAAAIANVEMRYGPDGFVVRTGWAAGHASFEAAPQQSAGNGSRETIRQQPAEGQRSTGPAPSTLVSSEQGGSSVAASEQIRAQLVALQSRLDRLEGGQTAGGTAAAPAPAATDRQLAALAASFRKLLAESEQRQRSEVALQVAEVWKDFNAVRASDIARVQQTVGRAQVITNTQLKQQRESIESLGTLYRVSLQK